MLKIIEERNSVAGRQNAKRSAPEIDLGMLNSLIGFNLRMAQGIMYRHYAERVAKLGMGQRRFAVLELIACNPGVSQVDIAAVLNVDRPAMMLVVDHLENRKLILRRRSEKDRRRQELHLTPNGVEFLKRIRAIVRDHEKTFASLFSKTGGGGAKRAPATHCRIEEEGAPRPADDHDHRVKRSRCRLSRWRLICSTCVQATFSCVTSSPLRATRM